MVRASSRSRRQAVARSSFILLSAVLVPLLAQPACGSDDGKKKAGPRFMDGGEGMGVECAGFGERRFTLARDETGLQVIEMSASGHR